MTTKSDDWDDHILWVSSKQRDSSSIELVRQEPIVEEIDFDGHLVQVSRQHCVDAMESSAPVRQGFRYDYEMFEFSLGTTKVIARAYAHEPDAAHFLGIDSGGSRRPLGAIDLRGTLVRAAIEYLRNAGKTDLTWLDASNETSGYSPIP